MLLGGILAVVGTLCVVLGTCYQLKKDNRVFSLHPVCIVAFPLGIVLILIGCFTFGPTEGLAIKEAELLKENQPTCTCTCFAQEKEQ